MRPCVLLITIVVTLVAAFVPLRSPSSTTFFSAVPRKVSASRLLRTSATPLFESISESISDTLSEVAAVVRSVTQVRFNATGDALPGMITRLAAKPKDQSRVKGWTTYKPPVTTFYVTKSGATGDYNHYRTTGMKGTNDRALSIITTDVMAKLESEGWPLTDGDLGINLLISGFPYGAFVVGKNYLFGAILVQITEPIQPCGYLCTLPFLKTKKSCEQFLKTLKGRRGWYAKVLTPGQISVGDAALAL